jgi:1-deoxyxylulose-5-phosphate synthase
MHTTALGQSSLQIPRIALGSSNFGREIDEKTCRELLDYAVENGINLIDSSEAYGGGNAKLGRKKAYGIDDTLEVSDEMHSAEKIIGRWLKERGGREQLSLCTKFNTGGRPEQVKKSLQDSLERLQTDHVEIYMLHCWFKDVPIGETLGALTEEVKAGRIRTIGCSNFTADQVRESQAASAALGLERMNAVQPAFSLADPGIRSDLLPYCTQHGIATITYSPLAAGFLTGKYTPGGEIPKGTRFDVAPAHTNVYFSERNFRIVGNLQALSAETGEPMTRLAMAWVFQHTGVSTVLVGARKQSHLDNALEAMQRPLDPALISRMNTWLDAV